MIGRRRSSHDVFVLGEEALDESAGATTVLDIDEPVSPLAESRGEAVEDSLEESMYAIDFDEELFHLGGAAELANSAGDEVSTAIESPEAAAMEASEQSQPRRERLGVLSGREAGGADSSAGRARREKRRRRRRDHTPRERSKSTPQASPERAAVVRRAVSGAAFGSAGIAMLALLIAATQLLGRIGETKPAVPAPTVAAEPPKNTPERDSLPRRTREREHERPEPEPVASLSPASAAPSPSAPVAASPSPPSQGGGSGGRESFSFER
jgi:hypothetical protein